MRTFNTAGPCRAELHYMLPAAARLPPEVLRLIDAQAFFVLHAPRQTGKTTSFLALARQLTESGRYAAALLSLEVGAAMEEPGDAEAAILDHWTALARSQLPKALLPPPWPDVAAGARIGRGLAAWAEASPRPLVLFLDEVDALQGRNLTTVLRQLRAGFPSRPRFFPASIGLIGMRDVRDYKAAAGGGAALNTASPFNVKARSLTLRDFDEAEVRALLGQHTAESGQVFVPGVIEELVRLTRGQPWLVNALAAALIEEIVPDRTREIGQGDLDAARRLIIARQDTHLDSLAERLREDRVRKVIEPILAGGTLPAMPEDDLRFVVDLGLVRETPTGDVAIANPIYEEVIPRVLSAEALRSMPRVQPSWLDAGGRLVPDTLLEAFLEFWRQHGEPLMAGAPYPEIAPHLVLLAFLHRVVNGGGSVDREYAIGRGRMDICVRLGEVRIGIEVKVWRQGRTDPVEDGLGQLDGYLDGLGLDTGWLVVFDRREGVGTVAGRTSVEELTSPRGRAIKVVRA